jgi:hypothetical protein
MASKVKKVAPTAGFISFSVASEAIESVNSTKNSAPEGDRTVTASGGEPFYAGNDSELRAVFKRLLKRDVSTKVKALQELQLLIPARSAPTLYEFLPNWYVCDQFLIRLRLLGLPHTLHDCLSCTAPNLR